MPADKVTDDRGALEAKAAEGDDAFSGAFEEAEKIVGTADLSAADDPKNVKAGEEPPPADTPPAPPPKAEEPPKETPPATPETYEQQYRTLQGIHRHDRETWEKERTKLATDLEEAKKPKAPEGKPAPTAAETAAAEAFIEALSPEQKEQLEAYEADFDVVSKFEGLKRTRELANLRKEMQDWKSEIESKFTTQSTEVEKKLGPVVKMAEETEREAHFDTIRVGYTREDGTVVPGHGDFEKFRDDGSLKAWIQAKPAYLQPAMLRTYSQGAPEDVVDLITDFKRESNIPLTPAASDNVVDIDSRKAQRKAALTTVTTRRGAVNTAKTIADDYEGAFDEALNK